MHAADDRDFLDHRQHFVFADLHGDRIGIAIRHQTAGAAVAHHAEAAAVINDDQVRSALFDELRADTRARSSGDDGLTLGQCGLETIHDFLFCVGISDSGPDVRHGSE